MITKLVAIALSSFGVFLACLFHGKLINMKWVKIGLFFWFLIPPVFLLTGMSGIALLVFAMLLYPFLLMNPSAQIPIFILTFAVIPKYLKVEIPFPGLNYLIEIDVILIFSFVFFVNILRGCVRFSFNMVDLFVGVFTCLFSFLTIRLLPLTSTLREFFYTFFTILIPYILFSKSYKDDRDITDYFKYFVSTGIILASLGLIMAAKQWDFFEMYDSSYLFIYRFGVLRLDIGQTPVFLGFLCGLSLLVVWSGLLERSLSPPTIPFAILLLMIVFMSLARGAWLAVAVQFLFYYFYKKPISNFLFVTFMLLFFAGLTSIFLISDWIVSVDSFGTILFRQQLYDASWQQFQEAPFFGDVNYREATYFDNLRLGGGFVDIVSYYLQIVLAYGLVGLFFFLIPFFLTIKKLIYIREFLIYDDLSRRTAAVVFAVLISYLCMVLTVSAVANIGLFGWIFLAISQAFLSAIKQKKIKSLRNT